MHLRRRNRPESLFDWRIALAVTAFGEICHMGFVLLVSRPFSASLAAVKIIGLPMIVTNSIGPRSSFWCCASASASSIR